MSGSWGLRSILTIPRPLEMSANASKLMDYMTLKRSLWSILACWDYDGMWRHKPSIGMIIGYGMWPKLGRSFGPEGSR